MKQFDLTFDEIVDFENLVMAHKKASGNGKRYRGETLRFTARLTEELIQIQNELIWGSYEVGPYRAKEIKIPKPRIIMALQFRDRVVQWAIYRKLNPLYENLYINDSYGCRKEKGASEGKGKAAILASESQQEQQAMVYPQIRYQQIFLQDRPRNFAENPWKTHQRQTDYGFA